MQVRNNLSSHTRFQFFFLLIRDRIFTFALFHLYRGMRLIIKKRGYEMMVNCSNKCAYCGSQIDVGERWVREKVYEPLFTGREPIYRRYHAELLDGQGLSCWEKHQLETETTRITLRAA